MTARRFNQHYQNDTPRATPKTPPKLGGANDRARAYYCIMTETQINANAQFIIDEFMRDYSRYDMIASICAHAQSLNIDDAINELIDAQFDDDFAIIFDDDAYANANSIDMIIECMHAYRDIIANELRARINQLIA